MTESLHKWTVEGKNESLDDEQMNECVDDMRERKNKYMNK